MKNAMKKLTSLLLVALLLVGMIPFAASAEEAYSVEVLIKGFEPAMRVSAGNGESFESVYNWCANQKGIDTSKYTASYWWYNEGASKGTGEYSAVPGNGILHVALTAIEEPTSKNYCMLCGEEVTSGSIHMQNCATCDVQWCGSHECPPAKEEAPARQAINWEVKYAEGGKVVSSGSFVPNGETANAKDILYYHAFNRSNDWKEKYECTKVWSSLYQKNVGYEGFVAEGDTVSFVLSPKTGNNSDNNNGNNADNVITSTGAKEYYKISGKVKLWVILDGVTREYDIKSNIAKDGKVTIGEVKDVVNYYYDAIDSDDGIICDGIYPQQGNFMTAYSLDQKYEVIEGLYDAANNSDYVVLKVFVRNAKLASSSSSSSANADSSNPKTGDTIYTAMAVMGISAAALASVMYFYNKKRIAL